MAAAPKALVGVPNMKEEELRLGKSKDERLSKETRRSLIEIETKQTEAEKCRFHEVIPVDEAENNEGLNRVICYRCTLTV